MRTALQIQRWPISRVGFDRIVMVSSASVGALKRHLPLETLKQASHKFEILTYKGLGQRLQSVIIAVGAQSMASWELLAKHETTLKHYSVVEAEIAYDMYTSESETGHRDLLALVEQLAKPRHQRGHLRSVHAPDATPPAGCLAEPTFYFETRKATVKLKCYLRQQKLPRGEFGGRLLRFEWTLTGKRALDRHVGGNKIEHLLRFEPAAFLKLNLRLERVDHVAVGRLFLRNTARIKRNRNEPQTNEPRGFGQLWKNEDYWAKRAGFLMLRRLAYRELEKFADWDQALHACTYSPAQVRGYLRELRERTRVPKRGRPKLRTPRRKQITDYRIDGCFVPLEPASPYNYRCSSKIMIETPLVPIAC